MLLMICTFLPYFDWSIIILVILTNSKIVFEAADIYLSVSHIMHANLQADSLDLCPTYSLKKRSLDQTSCLTTAFLRILSLSLCFFFVTCLMPRLTLEQVKAQQREAIRLRTERRVAELIVEQGKRDWEEVLALCAFLWLCIIVCFYAKLYFL